MAGTVTFSRSGTTHTDFQFGGEFKRGMNSSEVNEKPAEVKSKTRGEVVISDNRNESRAKS
jgi:hypothetical protein